MLSTNDGDRSTSGGKKSGRRSRSSWSILLAATLPLISVCLLTGFSPDPACATSNTLPPALKPFVNCPVNVKGVATCLLSSTTSTTFTIGSATVTSSRPTTLSLGLKYTSTGQPVVVLPTNGTQALQSPAIPLPGGLIGLPGHDGGPIAVTVTPQLVGKPHLNLGNLFDGKAPGLTLPIDVLVSATAGALGPDCTVADAADPITLNLTTGKTNPPPPNTSISGKPGKISSTPQGLITIAGTTLVDNSFAVPGTDKCFGIGGNLDEILDLDMGIPLAAGSNTARLSGSSRTAPAALVRKYLH